jgi:hypothetical protein
VRSRGGRIEKPFSQVTIVVEEKREKVEETKAEAPKKAPAKRKPAARKTKSKEQA